MFRVNLARPVPAPERNCPGVNQKKLDYAIWFMDHAVVNHVVFINECGYFGLQEVTEELQEGNGPTDRTVVSEEEMLLSQRPFHPLMVFYSLRVFYSTVIGGMNAQRFDDFGTNKTKPRS